ncbi:MAG TPA: sugar-binding protein [Prolixibacteraceae bacterium]
MKRIFTLLVCAFLFTMVMGQAPTAVVKKATVSPVIDGEVDAVWADANVYNIDKPYKNENPTVGASGTTTWQALWDDKGVYVLLKVNDNVWAPVYAGTVTGADYKYDHPEIYFDTNYVLKDGKGPQTDANGNGNGHYQFAPHPIKDSISGGEASSTGANGARFSYNVTDPAYMVEYFIPFTKLINGDGNMVDKAGEIGFDVTICDNDVPTLVRDREVWANVGNINESWISMDDCGTITLEGAETPIFVDAITLNSGGTITTDNGTLQMVATITPADASNKVVKWTVVNGTGKASIDANGLLKAITNGTVSVKATSTDGMGAEDMKEVVISGQVIDKADIYNSFNLIKNWNFDTNLTGWGNYVDAANMVQPTAAPMVQNGVATMLVGLSTVTTENPRAPWHYQLNQTGLLAEPDMQYVLAFKSWASEEVPAVVDFESGSSITTANGGDQYVRYGTSADIEATNKESEWFYTTPTEAKWFVFHVNFNKMIPTTIQKIQWMLSLSNSTIYIDSVLLVKQTEYDMLATVGIRSLANSISKVYPNPVGDGNTLFVELSKSNTKVAIYNAIGQKLMEKVATGTMAKFNVKSLQKGIYFIRLADGTTQKFIK